MNTNTHCPHAFHWFETGVTPARWARETYRLEGERYRRQQNGRDPTEALIAVAADVARLSSAREFLGLGCSVCLWYLESIPAPVGERDLQWAFRPGALCAALEHVTPDPVQGQDWIQATGVTRTGLIDPVAQAIFDGWFDAVQMLQLEGEPAPSS